MVVVQGAEENAQMLLTVLPVLGKMALTGSSDYIQSLTSLPIVCCKGKLITCQARNDSRLESLPLFVAFRLHVCILKWTVPRGLQSQGTCDSDEGFYDHSLRWLILSVRTPAQWCEGIVNVIAFKTGLGSSPRIFRLWSVKPITYLLREDTQSCVDESLIARANLCHLLWHHHILSVLKYSVRLLFCSSLTLQNTVDNAMNWVNASRLVWPLHVSILLPKQKLLYRS